MVNVTKFTLVFIIMQFEHLTPTMYLTNLGQPRFYPFSSRLLKRIVLLLLTANFLLITSSAHSEELVKYIRIDGQAQAVNLIRRSAVQYGVDDSASGNLHYKAELKDFPASKGSIAYIDNQWQGMLLHQGQMLDIRQVADSPDKVNLSSRALTAEMEMGQCGVRSFSPVVQPSEPQPITAASLLAKASRIDYDQLCLDEVEGICLVAELNVIFDSDFEDVFGSSFRSHAIDILSRVNVLYQENFKIRFKAINVGFGDGDEVTTSTDIGAVLQDLTDKRIAGELTSFDSNPDSLLHLVSGRDYGSDVNSQGAIGLAWISGYGNNYPNDVTPILCSNYAIGTSQVIGNTNTSRVRNTAIIMAHEIGHNFGFDHDEEVGSYAEECEGNFIMSPQLRDSLDTFSSCSQEALVPNLNNLSPIESCFDFPVAAEIVTGTSEITLSSIQPFVQQYQVVDSNLSNQTLSLLVTGSLSNTDARFDSVTLGGFSCELSNNSRSYSCDIIAPDGNSLLDLNIDPVNEDMTLQQSVMITGSSNIHELSEENNSSSQTIRFRGNNVPPAALSVTADSNTASLTWTDRSDNETGYRIEASADGGNWETLVDGLAINSQQYTVDDLNELTRYDFRVAALFADNSSATSNTVTINTPNGQSDTITAVVSGGGTGGGGGGSLGLLTMLVLCTSWLFKRQNL